MTDPCSIAEDERRAWQAFLMSTRLLMARLDCALLQKAGMTHASYMILAALSRQPEHALRMSELAGYLQFSKSRLTHAVGRLEECGWVERVACPTDRRGQFAVLTETGQAALAAAAPIHAASLRRHLFDRLTPEQVVQLRAIGEAIIGPLPLHERPARRERG